MLLSDGRFGRAPLRTPADLAEILPVPIYLYLSRYVSLIFPRSSRARPSDAVGFQPIRPLPSWVLTNSFPLWINGRQWQNIVVPILEDPRLYRWRGILKPPAMSPVRLPVTVNPPPALRTPGVCGEPAVLDGVELIKDAIFGETGNLSSVGTLYACDPNELARSQGRAKQYLSLLHGIASSYARGAYIQVNRSPATSTLYFVPGSLSPVNEARTSGLNNYDGRGTPAEVAADIAAAINDPLNAFSKTIFAQVSPAGSSQIVLADLIFPTTPTNGLWVEASDQTVTFSGSAAL